MQAYAGAAYKIGSTQNKARNIGFFKHMDTTIVTPPWHGLPKRSMCSIDRSHVLQSKGGQEGWHCSAHLKRRQALYNNPSVTHKVQRAAECCSDILCICIDPDLQHTTGEHNNLWLHLSAVRKLLDYPGQFTTAETGFGQTFYRNFTARACT